MKSFFLIIMASMAIHAGEDKMSDKNPRVIIHTNMGDVKVKLYADKAPNTVKNFLVYASNGFYDGTVFHRVIDGFMVQGGGFTKEMKQKPTQAPIKNEASNGVANMRGTIAMARTSDVHSATAQFFINVEDNDFLNFRSPDASGYGYCVFGYVEEGMDVVDKIRSVETTSVGSFQDVPVKPVEIVSIETVEVKS